MQLDENFQTKKLAEIKKNLSGALGDISIWYKAALDRYKVFVVNEADRRVDL